LFGIFLTAMGILSTISGSQQKKWPTSAGQVCSTHIQEKHEEVISAERERARVGYIPVIEYKYTVDGKDHDSTTRSSIDKQYSRLIAQKIIDRYPIGKSITVYYKPGNPDESVLEPGAGLSGLIFILGGLVVLTAGVLFGLNIAP
jgi:hypothetical protein